MDDIAEEPQKANEIETNVAIEVPEEENSLEMDDTPEDLKKEMR